MVGWINRYVYIYITHLIFSYLSMNGKQSSPRGICVKWCTPTRASFKKQLMNRGSQCGKDAVGSASALLNAMGIGSIECPGAGSTTMVFPQAHDLPH